MMCHRYPSEPATEEMSSIEANKCSGCGGLWMDHGRVVDYMKKVLPDQYHPAGAVDCAARVCPDNGEC